MDKPTGQAAPDPLHARDTEVIEGPDWREIQKLLEESTRIAELDWQWRRQMRRRTEIWARLAELGVTQRRMTRAYAIEGTPIISRITITLALKRYAEKQSGRAKVQAARAKEEAGE